MEHSGLRSASISQRRRKSDWSIKEGVYWSVMSRSTDVAYEFASDIAKRGKGGPVSPDFSCGLTGKFDFDSNTYVKCCIRSEGVVPSTLALKVGGHSNNCRLSHIY